MSGTTFTNVGSPTTGNTATIPSLSPATTYDVDVVATNSAGSATSAELTFTTPSGTAPAAPTGLSVSAVSATTVALAWIASASGSAPITYQPTYRVTGQTAWILFGSVLSGTTVTVSGLTAATNYDFQIVASNALGSATSAVITTTTSIAQQPPGIPTAVTTGTITATSIVLNWVASSSGSSPITYQAQYRITGQTTWTAFGSASGTLSATITGLLSGTSYDLEVVAINAAGSATSSVITAATPSVGVAPSAPTNLTITAVTPTSATLSWTASSTGTPPISYQAQYLAVGQTVWTSIGSSVYALTDVVTGLASGTTYSFHVIASNAAGSATSSTQTIATTTTATAPGVPGTPVAWIITPTSVSLTWAASSTGSSPINYQIQYRVTGQGSFVLTNYASSAIAGTVTGLTPGVDYDFQIIASNSAGISISNILTVLAPIVGGVVSSATYQPNEILTAEALDASLNSKLDAAGGSVGPLSISQVATGGDQPAAIALTRSAGGLGDSPLISGSYTAVMVDGPVVPYSSIGMTLTIQGDGTGNGPAGNVWNVLGSLNINVLRSNSAPSTGSQHAAVVGQVFKNAPSSGVPSGRRMADGWAVYAAATDNSELPSSQGGALSSVYSPMFANGRDDVDIRYAARIVYSEATPTSSGGYAGEFSRGLYVGAGSSTAYAKVVVELGGAFEAAALDLRGANAFSSTITSASPGASVTTVAVDRALAFASAGSPVAAVNASNPMAVTINGNPYSVVAVSVSAGGSSGTLTFASPVSATDAAFGNTVIPSAHTIWLSEGGGSSLPGDIALNRGATSKIYYDATGGGATVAAGTDRVSLSSTAATRLPVGSTAQRPAAPMFGDVRANSDTYQIEQWQPTTSSWVQFGTGSSTVTSGTAPGPATSLVSGTPTTSAVPLSWTAPTSGSTPFSYQVQYRITGVTAWTSWGGVQSTTSTTISGLTVATRYDFQVVTTNAYGSSTSAITSATTLAVSPSAPTTLNVSSITSTSVLLSWAASASGTQPISYLASYRVTGTTTWTAAPAGSTIGLSETITGLAAATSYDFEVTATNAGGSAISSIVNSLTSAAATVAPSAPSGVTAIFPTSSSIALSWVAPGSGTAPFSYQVLWRVTGTTTWTAFGSALTSTAVTVTGLSASTSYDFEVTATNSAGTATSSPVTGVTAATAVASTGTVSGSQTSGTTYPVISGPATGAVLTGNVLGLSGITITDPNAALVTGACTLRMACTNGTLSSTIAGAQISNSGTSVITYSNTLSACQTVADDLIYTAGSSAVSDNVSISFTDQSGATSTISIVVTVSVPSGGGGTGGTIPTDATGTQAKPAQTVLNGFGVNTHLDQPAYQTATLSTVENCINYLGGIKLLRDGPVSTSDSTWWSQVAQATNTQFIAYIPQGPSASFSTYKGYIGSILHVYIAALEGCDEADTGQAAGYAETLAAAAAFQPGMWTSGQNWGVPVIQMSFGQGYNTNPTTGNYGTVGNLAAYATYGNLHLFTAQSPMTGYNLQNAIEYEASLPTPGKPAALTEFGWNQTATAGYNNCSPTTAAAYILEMIFDAFNLGCPYYCWNSLLDDNSSNPIGLFTSTGSPRPSATAVKNLFSLLSDSNSNATTFSPGLLNYTITNFPTNSGGGNGGYSTLLQKSDGTFWLALWNEQPLNSTTTGADITVAPISITLTLGTTPISITVYDPSVSTTPVQSATGVSSLAISLPARVILVKVVHS